MIAGRLPHRPHRRGVRGVGGESGCHPRRFRHLPELHPPLPGSQEPLDRWIEPLHEYYRPLWTELGGDLTAIRKRISKDVHRRVYFNERYYLHPTDQGYSEMLASGQGRCEDITNMMTYASRSQALATAADYTPAWAHRDNNHAWNVALDQDGRGFAKGNAHAAKIYRKTFALQRDNLAFLLGPNEEAPNRWMSSKTYVDVTDQYAPTTDVSVRVDPWEPRKERFAYICVFNGGTWVPIHWGRSPRLQQRHVRPHGPQHRLPRRRSTAMGTCTRSPRRSWCRRTAPCGASLAREGTPRRS